MSVPAAATTTTTTTSTTTTTVLIFMGGVVTGIILIVTILLCCRIKSRHKCFHSQRGFAKRSRSQTQQTNEDRLYYDRNQRLSFSTDDNIYSKRNLSGGIHSSLKEVPIISSLNDLLDDEGCPTARLHQCNIVQIQIDSNKSFKFYSHYETPLGPKASRTTNVKKQSQPRAAVTLDGNKSSEPSQRAKEAANSFEGRGLLLKSRGRIVQSVSLADTLNLSPSLLKFNSRLIRSMPNIAVDFRVKSNKLPVEDRRNQQERRISFRKRLHNLKKYIDESIAENTCSESNQKSEEVKASEFAALSDGTKQKSSAQEMSKELWQLRAMLADADELESEESPPSTPHNEDQTSATQSGSSPSCEPWKNDHRSDVARSRKVYPLEVLNKGTLSVSGDRVVLKDANSQTSDDASNLAKDTKADASVIQKKPSVRRQIYRNAIARQQQKNLNQQNELHSGDSSKAELKPESLLTSEESGSTEQPSFESFKTGESCSSDDVHNNRLERLRGDSGYKSLENQQSLRTSFQLIIQESNMASEDEGTLKPGIPVPLSSASQILTRRVHSADETFVTIPLSLLSTAEEVECPDRVVKKSHKSHLDDTFFVKERRDKGRIDQKTSQNFFSQSKSRNHLATSSEIVSIVKPIFCNTSLLSTTSSFASSLFSRFLKSHSRRTYTRTQRDYSIDERSDAIFNEFLRFDPTLEVRHTLSRTSPRSRQRLQRYKLSDKYSPVPPLLSRSPEKDSSEEKVKGSETNPTTSASGQSSFPQNQSETNASDPATAQRSLTANVDPEKPLKDDDDKDAKHSSLKYIPVIHLTEEE